MYETNKLLTVRPLVDERIISETLTRIGIVDRVNKVIYQSCHLYKNFGTYYLAHFKQLFTMGTSKTGYHGFGNVSLEDIQRRNSIAFLLASWKMIEIVHPEDIEPHGTRIDIVPYREAKNYRKVKKFNINNLA